MKNSNVKNTSKSDLEATKSKKALEKAGEAAKRRYVQNDRLVLNRFIAMMRKMNEYVEKHPELIA